MTKEEAKQRIGKLKDSINHHRYLYHVLDKQEISDAALDSLKKELFDLEQEYPEFITPDSPTQRIGGEPLDKFSKIQHKEPMLSFNDMFSEKDMDDWQERIFKLLSDNDRNRVDFYCELKIDGLAMELVYKDNMLFSGSTRGDGLIGEDVTLNLKTIDSIPLKIRAINEFSESEKKSVSWINQRVTEEIVLRGEVFVPRKEFERINNDQKKNSLPVFANPRNMAAGSIRQLDPKITAQRGLDFIAYDLITECGQVGHEQEHQILKFFGFRTSPQAQYCKDLNEAFKFYEYWKGHREELPYDIDGVVVTINNNGLHKKLGVVGKAPRGAVAFKFPLKQAATIIEDIIVQVGRTGALTPVAVLRPIEIGGVKISRATLHNEDEIKRLGVKIGDTVVVGRAGDVIPDIVKVLPELRTGQEKEFIFPRVCPVCGKATTKGEKEAVWRCMNPKCFNRQRKNLYHFVSRGAFNIDGLGPKIISKLLDAGLISDAADLFKLEIGDIIYLDDSADIKTKKESVIPGFAEKSSRNLIESIAAKKKIGLARFIYALGIRNVGEETARDLADYFGSLEKFQKAKLEELQNISDIGPVTAESIYQYLYDEKNVNFLEKLKVLGIEVSSEEKSVYLLLNGKTFVLTGTLSSMPREKAKEIIRRLGGKISESVSRSVDFVVAGENPGSKLKDAQDSNVKIINEDEFLALIKHQVK